MKLKISSSITAALTTSVAALLVAAAAQAAPLATGMKSVEGANQNAETAVGLPVVQVAKKRVRVKRARRKIRRARKAPRSVRRVKKGRKIIRRGRIVRRRLSPRRRYYRRRALNRGIGIGIGIGVIALIARESANAGFRNAMYRCDRDYRSFDWETGTYLTYGGEVRLCPHLRPYI